MSEHGFDQSIINNIVNTNAKSNTDTLHDRVHGISLLLYEYNGKNGQLELAEIFISQVMADIDSLHVVLEIAMQEILFIQQEQ